METIRILIYTDLADISDNIGFFGLTDVQRFIKYKWNGVINFEIDIINRHYDYVNNRPGINGATLLTKSLLDHYHELWVFGFEQANRSSQPLNELVKDEIKNLRAWMQSSGVLITGDHSNPFKKDDASREDPNNYLNLGRALGQFIPRAGDLRVWKGPPTGIYEGELEKRKNYNTQEGTDPCRLDDINLELDPLPQTLRLRPPCSVHRLFWWSYERTTHSVVPILKFPDHIHEGKLTTERLGSDWPKTAKPEVVAQGRDKRFPDEQRYYDLVVAFDGDPVGLGRIVADSSFHHYLNINLLTLSSRDNVGNPIAGTDLDQIAQYYANLAYWLAPKKLRDKISLNLLFRAAGHPAVIEELGGSTYVVGRAALRTLTVEIGLSNLYRMLAPSNLEKGNRGINGLLACIFLNGLTLPQQGVVEPHAALGYVIRECHSYFEELGYPNVASLATHPTALDVINRGLSKAFKFQINSLETLFSEFTAESLEYHKNNG